MVDLFGQIFSVFFFNMRGIVQRLSLSLSVMLCVALVIATLLSLDALNRGLTHALKKSGSSNVALIMRGGSQSEMNSALSGEQVNILRTASDGSMISPEVNLIVDGIQKSDGKRANLGLRGLSDQGIGLRSGVNLVNGRWPSVGAAELVVGTDVSRRYTGFEFGETVRLGAADWKIVGVFDASGGVAASEIWADLTSAQTLFDRTNSFQSVRVELASSVSIAQLVEFVERDPRLNLSVQTELEYYSTQAAKNSELIQNLAWPLAGLMGIGALIGALNIILASLAERRVEIATFRAVGFRRSAICFGIIIEYVLVCLAGGLLGAIVSYLALNGAEATALAGGVTRIGYYLQFSPNGLLQAILFAATLGALGSMVPAISASLRPVTSDLTR
ncbi:MAG: ABC transporter permease [Pseudomonadota bacterium]